MILFDTKNDNIYNKLINILLNKKIRSNEKGDLIELIMPKYIYRKNFYKCEEALMELIRWTNDTYNHRLDVFHQLMLYNFLEKIAKKMRITKGMKKEITEEEIWEFNWIDIVLSDKIISCFEEYYEQGKLKSFLKDKQDLIKKYEDILPQEIIKDYQIENINLIYEVNKLLDFIDEEMKERNLAFMFWVNDEAINEERIQLVLENIFEIYFSNEDVDITRESLIGSGRIDFKFYKNIKEKVLIEIKKAKSSNLKNGYEKQIRAYMDSWNCKIGYYVIICFNDKEIEKVNKLIKEFNKSEEYDIKVKVLDARIKNKKFLNYNNTNINKEISKDIDKYFNYINKLKDINSLKDALQYLHNIILFYNMIEDKTLKKEFVEKFNDLVFFLDVRAEDIFSLEHIKIWEGNEAFKRLLLSFLNGRYNTKNFVKSLKFGESFLGNFTEKNETTRINKKDIKADFKILQDKFPLYYDFFMKKKFKIYLLDYVDKGFNSSCIPVNDSKEMIFLCTYFSDIKSYLNKEINGIYMFLYLLGSALYFYIDGKDPDYFKTFLKMTNYKLTVDNPDFKVVFADSFTMYILYYANLNQYNYFRKINIQMYEKLKIFFEDLGKKLEEF